ncbi:unnamed protein product [Cylindrotheca closterium]|uniref:Transmembrane protein n=1 Tax=Cylindrotheca closterium TaxID=2856 RepID=A0AAD2FLX1_9STRA|nr:unnamed protein product [Cylindrotheca closterium]
MMNPTESTNPNEHTSSPTAEGLSRLVTPSNRLEANIAFRYAFVVLYMVFVVYQIGIILESERLDNGAESPSEHAFWGGIFLAHLIWVVSHWLLPAYYRDDSEMKNGFGWSPAIWIAQIVLSGFVVASAGRCYVYQQLSFLGMIVSLGATETIFIITKIDILSVVQQTPIEDLYRHVMPSSRREMIITLCVVITTFYTLIILEYETLVSNVRTGNNDVYAFWKVLFSAHFLIWLYLDILLLPSYRDDSEIKNSRIWILQVVFFQSFCSIRYPFLGMIIVLGAPEIVVFMTKIMTKIDDVWENW